MASTAITSEPTMEADVLKGFYVGTAIGCVIVAVVWGAVALVGGLGRDGVVAVALFTTAWGGPGFGGMLGAVSGYTRHEARLGGSHRVD